MKVLKFGAVWCPGCLVMKPRWQKIEQDNPWLKTEYYDIDEFLDMKERYNFEDIPVFIWLDKNEQEIDRRQGEISEAEILELINRYKSLTLRDEPSDSARLRLRGQAQARTRRNNQ